LPLKDDIVDEQLTANQIADRVGVSYSQVRQWIMRGQMRSIGTTRVPINKGRKATRIIGLYSLNLGFRLADKFSLQKANKQVENF
jgi:DNA-binding transcriptional regulator LsrR (DeoR family)